MTIKDVAEYSGVSVSTVSRVLNHHPDVSDAVRARVMEAVEKSAVQLVGFGSFEVKERAARTGKNPATGEQIDIPASKAPAFKAGKAFKDAIQ